MFAMRCDLVVLGLVLVGSLAAQGVALPNGTGQIAPSTDWTVLQQAELEQDERATDPTAERSRASVLALIQELRTEERTAKNVVLHRQGPNNDALQLINCYSDDVVESSSTLLGKDAVERTRDALIDKLSTGGRKVVCSGFETSQLWGVPSLLLHFEHETTSSPWRLDTYIVPAGDHLQYFECEFTAGDSTAQKNSEDVLATFSGAKEPESTVSNLMVAGLAGAVAGILTALYRRKRQHQRMSAAGV
ncbi:MAG: hypothetical protein ACI89X_001623 [Planctomycetota bacterium]|jgi:hypothetical protein